MLATFLLGSKKRMARKMDQMIIMRTEMMTMMMMKVTGVRMCPRRQSGRGWRI